MTIRRPGAVTLILSLLLAAAVIAIAMLYPIAARPLYRRQDQPLVDHTLQRMLAPQRTASRSHTTQQDLLANYFALAMHFEDRTCIEFRSKNTREASSYLACYAKSDGRLLYQAFTVTD